MWSIVKSSFCQNAKASVEPKEYEDLKKANIYENEKDEWKLPVEAR